MLVVNGRLDQLAACAKLNLSRAKATELGPDPLTPAQTLPLRPIFSTRAATSAATLGVTNRSIGPP